MKLVGSVIIRDEGGRYLRQCVTHLMSYCDEVRIYDDCSIDDGATIAEDCGAFVKRGDTPLYKEIGEGAARQALVDWTLEGRPTHVLSLDADEFVPQGGELRTAIERHPGAPCLLMPIYEIWRADDDGLKARVDGGWAPHPVPFCWRAPAPENAAVQGFTIAQRKLASGREPQAVTRAMLAGQGVPVDAHVLHFGWADPATRQRRYDFYATADGGRFHSGTHLDSILWPAEQIQLVDYRNEFDGWR